MARTPGARRRRTERELAPRASPPPWILGLRGAPLEAPENTLAGLRRALDLGLDGFQYDLRACATGEAVLLRDARLERTTDGAGLVEERSLAELFRLDAGSWFGKRFAGEPLPLFDDVLEFQAEPGREPPLHWIEVHDPALVDEIAERVAEPGARVAARIGCASRALALAARDAGLKAVLLAPFAQEDDLAFVRDERITGYATPAGGWRGELARAEWPCERWQVALDRPADLLEACRRPLFGFSTAEPQRALAVRELVRFAPHDEGPYPIGTPRLGIESEPVGERGGGEWRGSWHIAAHVRNPFSFPVRAGVQLFVRLGAFEVEGLPARIELAPGEELALPFQLSGGSWSPGGDPLIAVLFQWRAGPGRAAGKLLLDAPLERVRFVVADAVSRRVRMLRESPGQPEASMTVRRRGSELVVAIENAGGLADARALVHLAGLTRRGGQGVRVRLPEGFDQRSEGVPFSCGFEGRVVGARANAQVLRRWAGGLPEGPASGAPGLLVPVARG